MEKSGIPPAAVVDTNLFVRALLSRRGPSFQLAQALRRQQFSILLIRTLLDEYLEVFHRPVFQERFKVRPEEIDQLLVVIEENSTIVAASSELPVQVRDPKGEMVLAAALGGNADFLVTGDNDLLSLAGLPELGSLRIVTVEAFLIALQ